MEVGEELVPGDHVGVEAAVELGAEFGWADMQVFLEDDHQLLKGDSASGVETGEGEEFLMEVDQLLFEAATVSTGSIHYIYIILSFQ